MAPIGNVVFATLLMNDGFLPGAMVLGHSLRDRGAKTKLAALVTLDSVSSETVEELRTVYDDIISVKRIVNKQPANLYVMNRPDLISTFTKIELFRQTQYSRIVYFDADVVCLRAPNELLTMDTQFAAVPDIGWPDCFNSGMMVLNPNMGDYYSLLALAQRGISFDGADQGLLNMHFRDWERLSFAYNCTPSGNYQYVPAYRHFQSSINAVHFIGRDKPWTLGRENRFNQSVYGELLGRWWAVYDKHYHPQATTYVSAKSLRGPKRVQDYVAGEETIYLPESAKAPPVVVHAPSEPTEENAQMERPMGDAPSPATQVINPTSTAEQRRFSAPFVDWDPSRGPPPSGSKPEASNFPTQTYDMSREKRLFQPPSHYPNAPRNMWYQVPETAPEDKPKPIFPWEGRAPKPTRVFPEPRAPTPPPEPEPAPAEPESATTATAEVAEESTPPEVMKSPDPWAGFQQRSNAWDDIPEIEKYMQSIQKPKKGKIQVIHQSSGQTTTPPSGRKPSLKLTDFPTEDDRPSLPVTPAPVRRPSFWGSERDQDGNLPAAEGVPHQEEWNPIAKLEELQRRQSEVLMSPTNNLQQGSELPDRQMPDSSSLEAVQEADEKATSPDERAPKPLKPILKTPTFEVPPAQEPAGTDSSEPDPLTTSTTTIGVNSSDDPSEPKIPSTDHIENAGANENNVTTVQS